MVPYWGSYGAPTGNHYQGGIIYRTTYRKLGMNTSGPTEQYCRRRTADLGQMVQLEVVALCDRRHLLDFYGGLAVQSLKRIGLANHMASIGHF
jgi:hypothetical protein